jgi:mono/diheme cytochrome c family protein
MMRFTGWGGIIAGLAVVAGLALGQEGPGGDQVSPQRRQSYQNMTPEQRAAATREFLGLGPKPDKEAAARGAPLFQRNCSFCHGAQARGATGPSLITSDVVLGDDHGEKLAPYVKKGRPEQGMPAFASMPDASLNDIAEFLHLQVEEVANRGAYHVLNILVGNKEKGRSYVEAHCTSCHTPETFAHIGSRFRSPDQLQRAWIWPPRSQNPKLAVTATVRTGDGRTLAGRVVQISDFRINLVDADGRRQALELGPGMEVEIKQVEIKDPLAAHEPIVMTLSNEDMHNVTAYFASLK